MLSRSAFRVLDRSSQSLERSGGYSLARCVSTTPVSSTSSSQSSQSPALEPLEPAEVLKHHKNLVPLKTSLTGRALLNSSILNKGAAFTREERKTFKLESFLPYEVHPLELQVKRAYEQYKVRSDPLSKYTFLSSLRDQNQILFYNLLVRHIKELLPVIYTPTVGDAIQQYSHLFRRPVGAYFSLPNIDTMEQDLLAHKGPGKADLIVVTDSEGILGIGDQGVGGIYIAVGKANIYSIGGGIHPLRILPVVLDVGTNNQELLDDPLYLGWKNKRVRGEEYDRFVSKFCDLVRKHYPDALLHFEDFGMANAQRLLDKYMPIQSVFNDDISGTAAVTMAALKASCGVIKSQLKDQRILVHGFGSAGYGIASFLRQSLIDDDGLSPEEASARFYGIDKDGLLIEGMDMPAGREKFARKKGDVEGWVKDDQSRKTWELLDVVKNVKPTVLIGVSTQRGAFSEEVVREMAKHVERPIIFPLSNPTSKAEAVPIDVNRWTDGRALIATGSPFGPVRNPDGKEKEIASCNNALVYPGLGLGVIVSKARSLTPTMITAGVRALASLSPSLDDPNLALLPDLSDVRRVSLKVAAAVANQARNEGQESEAAKKARIEQGNGRADADWSEETVRTQQWDPVYLPLEYTTETGPADVELHSGTW